MDRYKGCFLTVLFVKNSIFNLEVNHQNNYIFINY